MLFAYVDETSNAFHYRTVALVFSEAAVREVTAGLDDVVATAAKQHVGIDPEAELHGHDLFQATEDWGTLKREVRARVSVYSRALQTVASHADRVFVEGLDRQTFRDRYADERDEHQTCFLHLLEKLNAHARKRRQNLVVVADEHNTALATQHAVRRMRREPVWGFRGQPDRLIDTVFYVPSAMSRAVQAVDLVAYLHQRVTDHTERDSRAERANRMLWSHLEAVPQSIRTWGSP